MLCIVWTRFTGRQSDRSQMRSGQEAHLAAAIASSSCDMSGRRCRSWCAVYVRSVFRCVCVHARTVESWYCKGIFFFVCFVEFKETRMKGKRRTANGKRQTTNDKRQKAEHTVKHVNMCEEKADGKSNYGQPWFKCVKILILCLLIKSWLTSIDSTTQKHQNGKRGTTHSGDTRARRESIDREDIWFMVRTFKSAGMNRSKASVTNDAPAVPTHASKHERTHAQLQRFF